MRAPMADGRHIQTGKVVCVANCESLRWHGKYRACMERVVCYAEPLDCSGVEKLPGQKIQLPLRHVGGWVGEGNFGPGENGMEIPSSPHPNDQVQAISLQSPVNPRNQSYRQITDLTVACYRHRQCPPAQNCTDPILQADLFPPSSQSAYPTQLRRPKSPFFQNHPQCLHPTPAANLPTQRTNLAPKQKKPPPALERLTRRRVRVRRGAIRQRA